jgi:hypothetical protein
MTASLVRKKMKIPHLMYIKDYVEVSYFFIIIHLFICTYIVWAISPLCPPALPSLPTPLLPGRTCSALFSNFVEE